MSSFLFAFYEAVMAERLAALVYPKFRFVRQAQCGLGRLVTIGLFLRGGAPYGNRIDETSSNDVLVCLERKMAF